MIRDVCYDIAIVIGRKNNRANINNFLYFIMQLHLVCDSSIEANDPMVKSAIDAARCRQLAISRDVFAKMVTDSQSEESLKHEAQLMVIFQYVF